jgi:AMP nucleosidase
MNHLREAMQRFVAGDTLPDRVRGCYPFVRIHTDTVARLSGRRKLGPEPSASSPARGCTRPPSRGPDLYGDYYLEQFGLLKRNHGVELEVGTSNHPIPGALFVCRARPPGGHAGRCSAAC